MNNETGIKSTNKKDIHLSNQEYVETIDEIILNYMEKENYVNDISYEWIKKDINVEMLCKCIIVDNKNIKEILSKRDFSCEFKVILL